MAAASSVAALATSLKGTGPDKDTGYDDQTYAHPYRFEDAIAGSPRVAMIALHRHRNLHAPHGGRDLDVGCSFGPRCDLIGAHLYN